MLPNERVRPRLTENYLMYMEVEIVPLFSTTVVYPQVNKDFLKIVRRTTLLIIMTGPRVFFSDSV